MLIAAADAWSDRAGGTSGALWGAGLLGFASELADEHLPTARDLARAVATGLRDIQAEGGAVPGDKTLVDALAAFSSVLTACVEDGQHLAAAWSIAADDATTAASATARLEPRLGRARPLAARSLGNPDPGAVSMALCLQAIASALADIDHSTGKEHTQ
jgi:dihydroxyacetone kinase